MSKQQIHAWVDAEIYLILKTKKINISSTVNNLLKQYIQIDDNDVRDILKLQDQMTEAKKERDRKTEEIELIAVEIAKMKENSDKEEKERLEKNKTMIESIKRSGLLDE